MTSYENRHPGLPPLYAHKKSSDGGGAIGPSIEDFLLLEDDPGDGSSRLLLEDDPGDGSSALLLQSST